MIEDLVHLWAMIRLNIYEAKTHLSRYLKRLAKGERIILCRRNVPIAEISPLPAPETKPRPIGLARGRLTVPPSFFEPLPDDLLDRFEGRRS
jgi:antitoxin (DNA-binding transcriptional repressor) of toxin-antitoxin stability system